MIVYNLACKQGHTFEGWFKSPADFENQRDRCLVECPVCADRTVERKLHAPRVNVSAAPTSRANAVDDATLSDGSVDRERLAKALAAMAAFAVKVRENTENVGERFAEEARAMHYGEKPHRGIRGRADPETAAELREEGIEFQSLPFPVDWPTLN